MSGKSRFDWEAVKNAYVSGGDEVTLATLSDAPDSPSIGILKLHASNGDWTRHRAAFRYQTSTKTLDAASTTESEVATRHVTAARALMAVGLRALRAIDPLTLKPGELREFIISAADMERKALGLEVSRVDVTHHDAPPVEPPRAALEEAARELQRLLAN